MYDHSKPLVDNSQKSGPAQKLLKLIGGLLTLCVVILVGLSLFVRFYLTEERLKTLIIPPAESALGRTVTLGGIDVGLFSGITVQDLTVKEADNTSDFLSVGRFVLRYKLFPLLQKKLVISEVAIDQPTCRIIRDKDGHFNFDSLAVLNQKTPKPEKKPAASPATQTALPLALTVDRITINKAQVTIHDAKKELPEVNATASADIGVAIGANLSDLKARGSFDFATDIAYGSLKPRVTGKGNFDNQKAACNLTLDIDQQLINITAAVKNIAAKPLPPMQLDIASDRLNIDKLLALTEKLPKTTEKPKTTQKEAPKDTIAAGLPPGLDLAGSVKVREATYQKLATHDFSLLYTVREGIATISDLSFKVAGGNLNGKVRADLTTANPAYNGTFTISTLQIQELLAAFASPQANIIAGGISSDLKFFGNGFSAEQLKKNLNLDATYSMQNPKISETPLSKTLATVLQLEQLRNLALNTVAGNLQIKKGKLYLRSQMNGANIKMQTDGNIDINNGNLDLPLQLEFSGAMAEQLRQKASFLKYLSTKEDSTALSLKITGSTSSPKATLDKAAVEKQIKQQIEKKAMEEIGKKLLGTPATGDENKSAEPVQQLFKGLFGN